MLRKTRRTAVAVASTGALALSLVAPASAAPQDLLHADTAVARSCFAELLPVDTEGAARREVTSTVNGLVQARLTGAAGDWDVAVFDRATGNLVVASTALNAREFAEAFVTEGRELVVQACRYAGEAADVPVSVDFVATTPAGPVERSQLVRVATPERADKDKLLALGLDVTESADADSVDVVLDGGADREVLQDNGLRFAVLDPDLAATARTDREQDTAFEAATDRSELPSGRTSYRNLWDYTYEMKDLARLHPDLVRVFTLPNLTVEGREVLGVEIATNVANLADGKPVNLTLGLHHAREWPSGEHALEWAYDLVQRYAEDTGIRGLVERTRSVIVPVVNPDGFAVSREAPPADSGDSAAYTWKRKNCRADDATPEQRGGRCRANPAGIDRGTDLNRNYGGFWGGPGGGIPWTQDTFRGSAPFSEPETRNVRALVSGRQVTNLLSLHTSGNLVNRVPGLPETRLPLDEPATKALGDLMASRNGYTSQYAWQLYSSSGTTEDWSYWATGGYAYTVEIGQGEGFHPPFETGVVAEYLGKAPAAGEGKGGNRRAFLDVLANTATPEAHSTLVGTAPAGSLLSLHKAFQTPTSRIEQESPRLPLPPLLVKDVLDSALTAPGGRFEWAVNPSTRPYVADRLGREPQAPAQPRSVLVNPPGTPPVGPGSANSERVPFTVRGLPQHDNAKVTVSVSWADPAARWRVRIEDSSGRTVAASTLVSPTTSESVLRDPPPGDYTAVVTNFRQPAGQASFDWIGVADFAGPVPPVYGTKEPYALTCKDPTGKTVGTTDVYVDRGQTVDLGDVCASTER